jgi:hypothetical protein
MVLAIFPEHLSLEMLGFWHVSVGGELGEHAKMFCVNGVSAEVPSSHQVQPHKRLPAMLLNHIYKRLLLSREREADGLEPTQEST